MKNIFTRKPEAAKIEDVKLFAKKLIKARFAPYFDIVEDNIGVAAFDKHSTLVVNLMTDSDIADLIGERICVSTQKERRSFFVKNYPNVKDWKKDVINYIKSL